ncbi:MAG: cyclic nucleotide-binding domain-containing protein, partial [Chloroflexi bacterium]
MSDIQARVILLDKIHLFNGLDQDQLADIATKLEDRTAPAGTVIFKRTDPPDGFYMIFRGKVKVTIPAGEKGERRIGVLYGGDYFGEEALFENRNRSATVTAEDNTELLFLSRHGFDFLLNQYEKLRPNFQVTIKSRRLARST